MHVSTVFDSPRQIRTRNLKMAAVGAAALLLVGASALAYASFSRDAAPAAVEEKAAASRGAMGLSVGVVSGAPLVPVDTPIRLAGAAGLASAGLTLTYDPAVVSVLSVAKGTVPQSALTWRHDAAAGVLVILLTTSLPKGVSGDDTLAVVTLEAKDGAVGEVSPLTLTVRNAVAADGEAMTIQSTSGSFRNGVPGDVTGNGHVDREDYDRLADWLVGEEVEVVALNADLDNDGKVTDADAVKLHQLLDAPAAA
jgi:Cohesin domain